MFCSVYQKDSLPAINIISCSFLFYTPPHDSDWYYGIPSGVCPCDHASFPDNSYSVHRIALKSVSQLHHEVVHCILFRGCNTPNFDVVITLINEF